MKEVLSPDSNLINSVANAGRTFREKSDWLTALKEIFQSIGPALTADKVLFANVHTNIDLDQLQIIRNVFWSDGETLEYGSNDQRDFTITCSMYHTLMVNSNMDINQKSSEIAHLRNLFADNEIANAMVFPVFLQDELYGLLAVGSRNEHVEWDENSVKLLESLTFQLEQVIENQKISKRLNKTYRQARIGTWEMDLVNNRFSWSKVTRDIFEVDEENQPNHYLEDKFFKNPADKTRIEEEIKKSIESGEPYEVELEIITGKGASKWIRDTGQAETRSGEVVLLHGTVQDIDETKTIQIEMEKNRQLLEAITEQTNMAVWIRDMEGRHLFVNRKWRQMFGLENSTVIGEKPDELFLKKHAKKMIREDRYVAKENRQYVFHDIFETEQGPRSFMVNKFPLKNVAGIGDAVGAIGTDITELKETEKKVQRAEKKLRDIIEHSTNLFYTHTVDHELVYVSPQSQHYFGCSPEEAKRKWTDFATDNPVNEIGFEITEKAIRTGSPQPPYELELQKMTGEIFWVEVNEAPIVKGGETVSVTGSLTDITDRKKVRQQIKASLKEKETLLAEIHHRVKNNLAVVAGMMQMQAFNTEEGSELHNRLFESVLRIKSMANIHELLYQSDSFSNLNFAENISALVTDIVNTMQYQTQIDLKFDCENVLLSINQAIPSSLIINEVITNIIKHAFQGVEKGEVLVGLSLNNGHIEINISDNGNGLPSDFNLENSSTLGLQLIKTLSDQLGAEYKYISEGDGTIFKLRFEKE